MDKFSDLLKIPVSDLKNKIADLRKESLNLRFQKSSGQLEKTARIRVVRRQIARIKTVLNNKEVDPIAMYVFEFKYEFDRDDLSYIWQNLAPRDSREIKLQQASVAHNLANNELINEKVLMNDNLRWMVFKAKQRAKNNYFEKIFARNESNPNQTSDTVTNTSIGKKQVLGLIGLMTFSL